MVTEKLVETLTFNVRVTQAQVKAAALRHAHPFHLVTPSPWPFFTSISLLGMTFGNVLYFHGFLYGGSFAFLNFCLLIANLCGWWRDVIIEATFEGNHTQAVQRGLRIGFILFLVSEIMFFFSLFWAFFHSSLSPVIEIGGIWPPKGIQVLPWYGIPLVNTLILLSSGAALNWSHSSFGLPSNYIEYASYLGRGQLKDLSSYHSPARVEVFSGLLACILLGLLFTSFQIYEYIHAPFTIADGIYGSVFFLLTGFHGLHVIGGTIFLIVALGRHYYYHFTTTHHVGFELAAWYWHFVDVVWLFVYFFVYCWGS